jgi:multidrug resistance efflux pump
VGEEIQDRARRSRVWRRLTLAVGALFVLTVCVGAGAMLQQQGWARRDAESGTPNDAPLPPGAVLVVGSAEIDVDGGILPLSPATPGRIKSVRVTEGQAVTEGQPLLDLDATAAEAQVDLAEISLRAGEIQLSVAQQTASQHAELVRQQAVAVEVARLKLEVAEAQVKRAEKMSAMKVVDDSVAQAARDEKRVTEQLLRAEKLRAEQLDRTDPNLAVRAAQSQIEVAKRQLTATRQLRDALTLTAPTAGVVLRVVARQGQVLTGIQRDPAIWFRPDRPWVAHCEVEQQFADRVRPGLPCDIYDDQIDAAGWKGTVLRCSQWVGPRRNFGDDPLAWRDVRVVECTVSFDNHDGRLRVGQRVRVVIRSTSQP